MSIKTSLHLILSTKSLQMDSLVSKTIYQRTSLGFGDKHRHFRSLLILLWVLHITAKHCQTSLTCLASWLEMMRVEIWDVMMQPGDYFPRSWSQQLVSVLRYIIVTIVTSSHGRGVVTREDYSRHQHQASHCMSQPSAGLPSGWQTIFIFIFKHTLCISSTLPVCREEIECQTL